MQNASAILPEYDTGLTSFRDALVYSERRHMQCMLSIFTLSALFGLYRIWQPLESHPQGGLLIFAYSLFFAIAESLALRHQMGRLNGCLKPVRYIRSTLECLFPIVLMASLMNNTGADPWWLLSSPGYGVLMLIIFAAILGLDLRNTLYCGVLCCLGFTGFLLIGIVKEIEPPGDQGLAMYIMLLLLLIIATLTASFITRQARRYVQFAISDMQQRVSHQRLLQELELAEEIQTCLLPDNQLQLAPYELFCVTRPARQTGGDYYDWMPVSDNRLIITLADVAGHGIGPALVTATCRAYMRSVVSSANGIDEAVGRVNQLIFNDLPDGRFVTMALLDLDTGQHRLHFLSAGHAPSLLIRATGEVRNIAAQGVPLGVLPEQQLDSHVETGLECGDLFVLFSDGVYEIKNSDGHSYSLERFIDDLRDLRALPAESICEQLLQRLDAFRGEQEQRDDISIVVLKRSGV